MRWGRAFLAASLLLATPLAARAETYPARPVRLVVGFAAGGPTDVLARLLAQSLSERLGQQFIVENKPGAGSNLATEAVLNAAPDGYTLLIASTANAINASYQKKLPFDFMRDAVPVAGLARLPNVMVVHPSVPATTVAAFIAYAKANPARINMASGGSGTTVHLAGELFKAMAGVDLVHVPYRGIAPAMTDLIGGQVQVMFADVATSLPHIKSGALRALAVTTASPLEMLPGVPTIDATVTGYEASAWFGFAAPKGTPREIVDKLNIAINASLTDPKLAARLSDLGAVPIVLGTADFYAFVAAETAKWAKAVEAAGVKGD